MMLSHVQHLTKILVGLSGWIPPVKIYSNKEISQLPKFSTKRTSSTRQFQKFVRTFLESVETKSKGGVIKRKASRRRAARHLGRPTRTRDKRVVTIPTV